MDFKPFVYDARIGGDGGFYCGGAVADTDILIGFGSPHIIRIYTDWGWE